MQRLLAEVTSAEGLTFGLIVLLCDAMTFLGSLWPVMRAVRVDSATAFRAQ